jgi:hypothetical protein
MGERYALMAGLEALSHVLREHPILEKPGNAPPALRALATVASAACEPACLRVWLLLGASAAAADGQR